MIVFAKPFRFFSTAKNFQHPAISGAPFRKRIIFPWPIALFAFFLVFFSLTPLCQATTLTWAANDPIENVTGYKIHFGAVSHQYTAFTDVGNVTSCNIEDVITPLEDGKTYYLACTAYSPTAEGSFSAEVAFTYSAPAQTVTDSDGDGISDSDEINLYGTDPNAADSDNDGLSDGEELNLWGANWNEDYDADTIVNLLDDDADGDTILDGDDSEPGVAAALFTTTAYPEGAGVKGSATFNNDWQGVTHNAGLNDPIVIAGPSSSYDVAPGVIRLRNVAGNSFEIKFQEWQYLINQGLGAHDFEESSYLVLEEGVHAMADGSIWEAGSFDHSAPAATVSWKTIYFAAKFPVAPYLFLTVQTYNGAQPVIVRVKDVTEAQFKVALFEEEALLDGHVIEKIGYLAVYTPSPAGELNGLDAVYRLARNPTDSNFTSILGQEIRLEEEQSLDAETWHILESVNVLRIGRSFFSQTVSHLGADPFSIRKRPSVYSTAAFTDLWYTVPLEATLDNPVVITGPPSYNDADPGVTRLRNVTAASFDIKFQEWMYLSAKAPLVHKLENGSWLVMEPGSYKMADGSIWEVGTLPLTGLGLWGKKSFSQPFTAMPAVFLTMQTYNGADTVTVRARNVTTLGFEAALFEEEARMTSGHVTETIGYLAIYSPKSSGTVTINGQKIAYSVTSAAADDHFTPVAGREIMMEEEQSLDSEISHVFETLNTLTINNAFFSQEVSSVEKDTAAVRYR
ncbi:MAG: hypothetical protein HY885_10185 [Deltaproteobacteria bacterium]|nr:hypothetical protein [Deltaproteobacteria bacterium]